MAVPCGDVGDSVALYRDEQLHRSGSGYHSRACGVLRHHDRDAPHSEHALLCGGEKDKNGSDDSDSAGIDRAGGAGKISGPCSGSFDRVFWTLPVPAPSFPFWNGSVCTELHRTLWHVAVRTCGACCLRFSFESYGKCNHCSRALFCLPVPFHDHAESGADDLGRRKSPDNRSGSSGYSIAL